ncbi:MAG: glycosyltransferase family 2 protein [Candidatus Electrothrix sp. GM3_4]|nr:glycosyltransferase family 2 protein [Candidatus Electrothrix sp. GM3_4]
MLFSVVIPVFNSSLYIANTLDSVRKASISKNYEVLVVDDLSLDIDQLKNILRDYPEVSLIEKKVKTNAADSRNIGLLASKADIVFFIDSDDSFLEGAIDRRIKSHHAQYAGVIFGNFLSAVRGKYRPSDLRPYCKNTDMRDYIFNSHGDVRSSTISIFKKLWKNTLFDPESYKHQDWIYSIKCYDNKESIFFDERYGVIIFKDRPDRMSFSINVSASKYILEFFLKNQSHINRFSRIHWMSAIRNRDAGACKFFLSLYRPDSLSDYFIYYIYKFLSINKISYLSSMLIRGYIVTHHIRKEIACFMLWIFRLALSK